MRSSLNLGKIFGIKVQVHFTFVLIFIYVGYYSFQEFHSINEAIYDCFITLLVFCCVLMHEFGHALAARKIGIETHQILILPIGGMAQLDRMPEKSRDELFVTICGPLVNLGIIIVLLPFIFFNHDFAHLSDAINDGGPVSAIIRNSILLSMVSINALLFVFNLIPAFPMDGGRIFRAMLAYKLSYQRATLIAVRLGQAIALAFAIFLFLNYSDPDLSFWGFIRMIVLCVFIVILAGMEYRMVKKRSFNSEGRANPGFNDGKLTVSDSIGFAMAQFEAGRGKTLNVMFHDTKAGIIAAHLLEPASLATSSGSYFSTPTHTYHFNPFDSLGHALKMMEILDLPYIELQGCYLQKT